MKMSPFYEDNTCLKVYDVNTKQVIATYDTYKQASQKLGLTEKAISYRTSTKQRFHSPKLNKEVTCRISKREEAA